MRGSLSNLAAAAIALLGVAGSQNAKATELLPLSKATVYSWILPKITSPPPEISSIIPNEISDTYTDLFGSASTSAQAKFDGSKFGSASATALANGRSYGGYGTIHATTMARVRAYFYFEESKPPPKPFPIPIDYDAHGVATVGIIPYSEHATYGYAIATLYTSVSDKDALITQSESVAYLPGGTSSVHLDYSPLIWLDPFSPYYVVDILARAEVNSLNIQTRAAATATIDPTIVFDQAAFDQRYGAEAFNISDYYQIRVSPNLFVASVPEPSSLVALASGLLGMLLIVPSTWLLTGFRIGSRTDSRRG